MGLLTPCFVPGEGFLYTIIVPGGGFLLPSSRVPGVCPGGGWFWMKLIPALQSEFLSPTFEADLITVRGSVNERYVVH